MQLQMTTSKKSQHFIKVEPASACAHSVRDVIA